MISAYLSKDIIVFDIEGTGTDIFADNIIQLSAIKIRKGKKIAEFNPGFYEAVSKEILDLEIENYDIDFEEDYCPIPTLLIFVNF